jgi:hypothetical protein
MVGDRRRQLEQLVDRQRARSDVVFQRVAVHHLHDDEMSRWPLTSPMSKMVQMAGWFSELASRAGLRQQLRRQELDRDLAAEARVFGAIDHAHPAAAKLVEDAVVAADGGAR